MDSEGARDTMCTCGEPSPHVIMYRTTADGFHVLCWDDGAITGALGAGLTGVPVARPRTPEAIDRTRTIGRLFMGEVCIHDLADLPELHRACVRAAALDRMPGTVRRIIRERRELAGLPRLVWTVQHADRDGRPTERFCRLPRLRWPGLVVFDFCGGPGSSRGRYQLWRDDKRDGCCIPTGFSFARLSDLWAHLRDNA